jgi:hypothetical protein
VNAKRAENLHTIASLKLDFEPQKNGAWPWVHDKKEGFFDFSLFLALKV